MYAKNLYKLNAKLKMGFQLSILVKYEQSIQLLGAYAKRNREIAKNVKMMLSSMIK